jgi:hypothetical protein
MHHMRATSLNEKPLREPAHLLVRPRLWARIGGPRWDRARARDPRLSRPQSEAPVPAPWYPILCTIRPGRRPSVRPLSGRCAIGTPAAVPEAGQNGWPRRPPGYARLPPAREDRRPPWWWCNRSRSQDRGRSQRLAGTERRCCTRRAKDGYRHQAGTAPAIEIPKSLASQADRDCIPPPTRRGPRGSPYVRRPRRPHPPCR